jgi:GDP-D-mannose 3',5'-epimerase
MKTAIVTGAGGFIGSHLVSYLKKKGYRVKGIDVKLPEFNTTAADEFSQIDLRSAEQSLAAITQADELYLLAADMGGVGYISQHHADLMRNNTLINLNSLYAAQQNKVKKVFFASSACVYPQQKQSSSDSQKLKEQDAIPADPDTGYGWEKLYTEQLCQAFRADFGMDIKVARFHNIYGPEGTFEGGREKSPAAICRKVAQAKNPGEVEVWGDGKQTRSYCYIADCCEGVFRLMQSQVNQPVNIGTDSSVTIDQLVEIVAEIAGKRITIKHLPNQPQGVRGRNSDNTLIKQLLGWQPTTSLKEGLSQTYSWIEEQLGAVKK